MIVPSEADTYVSLVRYIQKADPKFAADHDMVNMIRCSSPISRNPTDPVASPVLEQCAADDEVEKVTVAQTFHRRLLPTPCHRGDGGGDILLPCSIE